jgi:hypothetical protein
MMRTERGCLSIFLTTADDKSACEILLAYLFGFLLNPSIKPGFLDPAEIVEFHIMWVPGRMVGNWRQ